MRIECILGTNQSPQKHVDGFGQLYKTVFAEKPYFERYTLEETVAIWNKHVKDGMIFIAVDRDADSRIIGFGAAVPLVKAPEDVRGFLQSQQASGVFEPSFKDTWYMSELGIANDYRGKGLGTKLVVERLREIYSRGGIFYVMRTAADGSNSSGIYRRLRAVEITVRHNFADTEQVPAIKSASTERIYLYQRCLHSLQDA